MTVGLRSRVVLVALAMAWGALPLGCRRENKETEQVLADAAGSYEQLKPKIAALKTSLLEVRKGADELAERAPGGPQYKEKMLATEEVLGVLDAKMTWLSGEMDAARKTGNKEQAESARDAVATAGKEADDLAKRSVELAHEKAELTRVAALFKAPFEWQVPTGYLVKGAKEGLEARLIGFLNDANKKVDKTTWFDFDRLVFVGGGAELEMNGSESQLENVSEILRAYPSVKLKLGGYTDNGGAAAASKKLSAVRAQAVRTALTEMRVSPTRLEAEGFSAARPVCPKNDTEECRAQNRRVALLVTAK